MKMKKWVVIALGFLFTGEALAQAQTVFVAPANKVSGALAEGITQNLIRRGFAANDPRIAQTIASVSSRTGTVAAAAGSGATWGATIARLSPWVTGGILVYQGVQWYFDNQGKAYLAPPGSTTNTPIFSNGVYGGATVYTLSNYPGVTAGSIQEAYSAMVSNAKNQYSDASFGVPTIKQIDSNTWSVQYNYSIPSIYLYNFSGNVTATSSTFSGNAVCSGGSVFDINKGCQSANLASSPFASSPVLGYDIPTAYNNLSSAAKAAPLSQDLAAETANRLYRDASSQPDFQGVPSSTATPVAPADFAPYQTAHPDSWPKTSDWGGSPVPTTSPVASPETNPNQVVTPTSTSTTTTKVDLGPDPGNSTPTLADPPTDLFKPIKDLMQPWLSWQVPAHSSDCPTWHASPSISGHVFAIDITSHCTIAEQNRQVIYLSAIACWVLIAAFIVLSA